MQRKKGVRILNIKEFGFNTAIAGIGTAVSAWFGGWDAALNVLIVLVVLDYITGLLGAIKLKKVNSEVMYWGGIRKIIIFAVVALAVLFDRMLGAPDPVLRTLAIYFYVAREGLSVTENLGKLGVPLPPVIVRVLEQLQTKGGNTK
jgi:toxin secretion/phage lysis holin